MFADSESSVKNTFICDAFQAIKSINAYKRSTNLQLFGHKFSTHCIILSAIGLTRLYSQLVVLYDIYLLCVYKLFGGRAFLAHHYYNLFSRRSYLTHLNPLSVRPSVLQNHIWARRALALRRSQKEAPRRGAELSSCLHLPCPGICAEASASIQVDEDSKRHWIRQKFVVLY